MNKKIFAANWKLNKTPDEARNFVTSLKNEIFKRPAFWDKNEVIIFPPAISLEGVATLCAGTLIGCGPQNVHSQLSGAFTGENSAQVSQSIGARYALVGHSERREIFKEDDSLLNKKNLLLQQLSMTPVFCIGESLQQRESGDTLNICKVQLDKGLSGADKNAHLIVAYEPVWAIGTGKVATAQQVAEVHRELYMYLSQQGFDKVSLLYGGSVKPDNASELLSIPHVDGFLIGGAALEVESFLRICDAHTS